MYTSGSIIKYKGVDCPFIRAADRRVELAKEEARKKLETQLSQTHKMQAIGQLTGGIAHDFNNILQAILGYVQLMEIKLTAGQRDDKQVLERCLQEVRRASERAQKMIEEMMLYSRSKSGESTPQQLPKLVANYLGKLC